LYSMGQSGLRHNVKYRKSAEVIGAVLGFYHPHGDMAVYDAMVRLAQPWNMRYPLIDGQGNFGSVDGDPAAAHRYTEARMKEIAEDILADIEKDTVDFMDNYSNTMKEPTVLPAKVPQLLLNGTVGIAVGMATNIPPHNLTEIMDGTMALIDNPEITLDEMMQFITGPDFPTGGIIFNPKDIRVAYETGNGGIVMRAVAEIVETKTGGHQIIVSELPYQVNKSVLIEKIADLVKEKKLIGIADLRDESDREGIRIAIDLKKDSYPKKLLNQLFKLTQLQSTFHVNLLALEDGLEPKVMSLITILQHFIDHRRVVVRRRTQFELKKAEERAHILEGLKIALDNLDAVIKTIRGAATREDAHSQLKKKFKLTDPQATAILEMRLQALVGLERKKVEDELAEKLKMIAEFKAILADPKRIDAIIKQECVELKEKYGDERKTQISGRAVGDFSDMDLIPNEKVVVTMTVGNYIKRQAINEYRTQRRGGKGVIGMTTKEEDQISVIQVTKNHDDILFFTNRGRVFRQKVFEIPQASRIAKGTAAVNVVQLAPEEKITALLTISEGHAEGDLIMITRLGVIKKTAAAAYANIRSNGLIAIKLDDGDELGWVRRSAKGDEISIVTKEGQSILFAEEDARPLGRSTRGVRAIKLRSSDEVIGADVAKKGKAYGLLVVSENGLGKQTLLSQYTMQHRGGVGVKTMQITDKTGKIIGAKLVERGLDSDLIITSKDGQIIRLPFKSIPTLGRSTQGVRVMRMRPGDKAASFSVMLMEEEDGTLSNPNEELEDHEIPNLEQVDVMAGDEEMEAEVKIRKHVGKIEEKPKAKAAKPVAKVKPAPAVKPVAKAQPKKAVVKAPASKAKPAPKQETKSVAFTKKKLTSDKKPAAKPAAKNTKAQPKPATKGFTKRKLK
jgi:DNA gyrase subunit A